MPWASVDVAASNPAAKLNPSARIDINNSIRIFDVMIECSNAVLAFFDWSGLLCCCASRPRADGDIALLQCGQTRVEARRQARKDVKAKIDRNASAKVTGGARL